MIELLTLGCLALADFLLSVLGLGSYLLLLYPAYLFHRSDSTPLLLLGGGFAALLAELLNHFLLGSLMLGVGVGLFLTGFLRDIVNWDHPVSQGLFLVFFLGCVATSRVVLIRVLHGAWAPVAPRPYLLTLLVGFGAIVVRYYRRYRVRRSL